MAAQGMQSNPIWADEASSSSSADRFQSVALSDGGTQAPTPGAAGGTAGPEMADSLQLRPDGASGLPVPPAAESTATRPVDCDGANADSARAGNQPGDGENGGEESGQEPNKAKKLYSLLGAASAIASLSALLNHSNSGALAEGAPPHADVLNGTDAPAANEHGQPYAPAHEQHAPVPLVNGYKRPPPTAEEARQQVAAAAVNAEAQIKATTAAAVNALNGQAQHAERTHHRKVPKVPHLRLSTSIFRLSTSPPAPASLRRVAAGVCRASDARSTKHEARSTKHATALLTPLSAG